MNPMLRLYIPVYSFTLLLSAFLLFGIQPMFGKMILPLLGGAPAVWNTAMVFFQGMLLAGYGYAHLSARFLPVRVQALLHIVLLTLFVFVLPIAIPAGWEPPTGSTNPAFWQLGLMTAVVGGPFFVLSGSAPLFQHWFARSGHRDAHNPYFLYAASNLGSMTALLTYPFITEPLLTLTQQSAAWAVGYVMLMACAAACGFLIWKTAPKQAAHEIATAPAPTWRTRLYWLILAFIPSSLMLGVTTYVTTDLAAVPLLWIIPLALYVGTFIIVFARSYRLPMDKLLTAHAVLLVLAIASFAYPYIPSKMILIPLHFLLFFVSALVCHQALADARPPAARLTEFYLIMSLGGVMGGILNALIAPVAFVFPIEYALALGAVCFVRYAHTRGNVITELRANWWVVGAVVIFGLMTLTHPENKGFMIFCVGAVALMMLFCHARRYTFALSACFMLALYPGFNWLSTEKLVFADRNFFGVSRIYDLANNEMRFYLHGVTIHGAQMLVDKYRMTPISYYNEKTSIGDIFRLLDERGGKQNVAVVGLGIGTLVCYDRPGRHFDLFEIDPDVQRIAEDKNLFTFLSDCGSPYDIILGDGRLQIEKMPDHSYDAIFLDAFSSDNIPIHIITKEAFEIYLKKLKPGGVIVANISNNFLDLTPALDALGRELGVNVIFKLAGAGPVGDTKVNYAPSIFSVIAPDAATVKPLLAVPGWRAYDGDKHPRVWTDDYASIISAFWQTGKPEFCFEKGVPYRCNAQNRTEKAPR